MNAAFKIPVVPGTPVHSGCRQTSVVAPVSGGVLTGTTAKTCRAAIAGWTNRPLRDIAVSAVAEAEAGYVVQASVTGAKLPSSCRTDRNGVVGKAM